MACFNTSGKISANEFYVRVKNDIFRDVTSVDDVDVMIDDINTSVIKTLQDSVLWVKILRGLDTKPKNVLNVVINFEISV